MEVAVLHNAKAGDEDMSPKKLLKLLRAGGFKGQYFPLKEALKDKAMLKEAFRHGKMTVVAGGDGSIRKVANRLIGKKRLIAPLPLGTANNIARSLGIQVRPIRSSPAGPIPCSGKSTWARRKDHGAKNISSRDSASD
jgi:diacylglycerol kinase (ATP)